MTPTMFLTLSKAGYKTIHQKSDNKETVVDKM